MRGTAILILEYVFVYSCSHVIIVDVNGDTVLDKREHDSKRRKMMII